MKLKFWVTDYDSVEGAEDYWIDGYHDISDLQWAVEVYAQHYYDNCYGWESSWPLSFSVAHDDGDLIGVVQVDMELVPSFHSRII